MSNAVLSGLSRGKQKTIIRLHSADYDPVSIGDGCVVIAGPCALESEAQIFETALGVKKAGADMLRGGAYKPRTSPYAFQGLGREGLKLLAAAGKAARLPVVSEALDPRDVDATAQYVDIIQIGSRNMHNVPLLKEAAKTAKPILLKRGLSATYSEWLYSAEYILAEGNPHVILCERGVRGVETYTRNMLDIAAVPAMKTLTHLPVIVDPSHATGMAALVEPMALAACAAGAAGIMLEVHPDPEAAESDAAQQISLEAFAHLMRRLKTLARAMEA